MCVLRLGTWTPLTVWHRPIDSGNSVFGADGDSNSEKSQAQAVDGDTNVKSTFKTSQVSPALSFLSDVYLCKYTPLLILHFTQKT